MFNRAMLLRATPSTLLKLPPMSIFPSGCKAVATILTADSIKIERLIDAAIFFQSRNVMTDNLRSLVWRQFKKIATDQNLAVGLHGKGVHVRRLTAQSPIRIRIEGISQSSNWIKPGDEPALLSHQYCSLRRNRLQLKSCRPVARVSAKIGPFALGLNESAKPVTGSSRASQFRSCPPIGPK